MSAAEAVWSGKYLIMKREGTWEYVSRTGGMTAVVILAEHEGHVLLVEQYRVPVGRPVLELPAGLVGDGDAEESIEASAARELEEETGYRPRHIEVIGEFASTPGMASETFHFVRATGLEKTGPGGGVDGENITVRRVALSDVAAFVAARRAAGLAIDAKLLPLLGVLP